VADHPFWFFLVAACVSWYATVTVYVAVRGTFDIQHMLKTLREDSHAPHEEDAPRPSNGG
jgi:hypothetical protein